MASREQFRKIAIYCDKYNGLKNEDLALRSGEVDTRDSCTNCSHYNERGRCELDLIDKVLSSLSMDLNLKS